MKVNWRDLLAFDDEIYKELSIRVEEFEEMTSRNKIEKEVYVRVCKLAPIEKRRKKWLQFRGHTLLAVQTKNRAPPQRNTVRRSQSQQSTTSQFLSSTSL